MTANIDFRALSWNINRDVYNQGTDRSWPARRDEVLDVIQRARCSMLLLQECSTAQAEWLTPRLGRSWNRWRDRNGNGVFWDQRKWRHEKLRTWDLTGGQSRGAVAVKLRHRATGRYVWGASSHLASGDKPLRDAQARHLARILAPYWWIVLGADLNNGLTTAGPRATLTKAGWTGVTTSDPRVAKATYTNYTTSTSDDMLLDDVLTKPRWVTIRHQQVIPTTASDHLPILVGPRVLTTNQKK